jgi:hypothetical protein
LSEPEKVKSIKIEFKCFLFYYCQFFISDNSKKTGILSKIFSVADGKIVLFDKMQGEEIAGISELLNEESFVRGSKVLI